MKPKFRDFIAVFLLNIIRCVHSDPILPCTPNIIDSCTGEKQTCDAKTKQCECIEGYTMVGESCEVPDSEDLSSHSATAAVVTIFTIALLVCALILVVKRYNLIEYIQQKLNLRRRNDIVYEDVMIGHDDPPLSP